MPRVQEEEEAGASGQCGLPRYAVGSEVEVKMTDSGFHGAYYEAIVTAILPESGGYEVVYSTLVEDGGGSPLRETAAPDNVRPRPPRGSPRRELNMFDMVEAYHNEGWWPGVVSGAWLPSTTAGKPRYAMSFPTIPEVVEVQASLVRLRRTFAHGRWMDTQEVMKMNNGIAGISPKEAHCNSEILINSEKIANASRSEFIPLSPHMSGQCPTPISRKSAGASSFVHPVMTMDLSTFIPAPSSDILPSELVTKSIQNMRIQDEDQLFQGKLSSLSELEENGFEVGALKTRLENLLFLKNQQMDLKEKKASLEHDILKKEMANTRVEQQLTVLDIGIKELEQMLHFC